MSGPVRILVVDDSEIFVRAFADAIRASGRAALAGVARDGAEAVEMARRLSPDVISMDVHMPVMDGLDAVERIMDEAPAPIAMVTAAASEEMSRISFRAIGGGALDVVAKPGSPAEAQDLVERLCVLSQVRTRRRPRRPGRPGTAEGPAAPAAPGPSLPRAPPWRGWPPGSLPTPVGVVGIAISTGGPPVLEGILKALPRDYPAAVLVVQHVAPGFDGHLVDWLRLSSRLDVRLAEDGGRVEPGVAWVARAERHLEARMGGRIALDARGEKVDGHRPSGTVLLRSLARAYGSRAAGLVMTGMGSDGAAGLLALKEAGGVTAAQDAASSAVDGMPKAARDLGAARHVLSADDVPAFLLDVAGRRHAQP